jgi:alkanesulfonate monooxygenase SsuD/methylene tetrahydromethanopterin reductase-like flavin-dependent oxidoreductase (luciferase family)
LKPGGQKYKVGPSSILEKFGVFVFTFGKRPPTIDSIVDMARHAENLGFDSVQTAWHFTVPTEGAHWDNRFILDPFVVLPVLAAKTNRIRISLNSGILPVLHPFMWAQYLASLDVVSGGRTIPALAVGWWREDFQVGLADVKERGKRFDAALEILTKLWKGESGDSSSNFWDVQGLRLDPLPSQDMPLWIGGNEKSIDRAGRWADALNPLWPTLEQVRSVYRPGLDAAAEKYGRKRVDLALLNFCLVVEKEDKPEWLRDRVRPLLQQHLRRDPDQSIVYGTPEQCAENISTLFAAGVDYIVFETNFHGWETEEFGKEQMSRFVDDVVPLLSGSLIASGAEAEP